MKENYESYVTILNDLETLLNSLNDKQINFKPSEDKWNINEITAHLADTEIQAYIRYHSVLADDVPFLVFHYQDNWAKELKHSNIPIPESLSLFKVIRENNYNLICSLSEEQLNREGLHSTRGKVTVKNLVESYIKHVDTHISQIKRNVEDYEKVHNLSD
jgi:hypothetical protein